MKRGGFDGPALVAALREPFLICDEGVTEEEAEAVFPLPNGTQFDPREPWELPKE